MNCQQIFEMKIHRWQREDLFLVFFRSAIHSIVRAYMPFDSTTDEKTLMQINRRTVSFPSHLQLQPICRIVLNLEKFRKFTP